MAAKKADQDRKAKIAEMQRQAKAAERRRSLAIVGVAVAVVVVIAGAVTFAIVKDDSRVPGGSLASLGVPAAQASCDAITDDKAVGSGEHVGPQTNKPDVTKVDYSTVPPTSGQHFVTPEYPNRQFYTADDRPRMETLVHNLEHGYTVLWYDDTATSAQVADLKAITREANGSTDAQSKFIVSAWDTAYGTFPAGKHFAMSHWSADQNDLTKQTGHRQLCGAVSGEVVAKFIAAHPRTEAPEPNAQ
ncbi:hypothetical protein GCM10027446_30230 [Angustibacter peucedani]